MSTYSSAVLADSPILYARLGESSGTSFTDSSTNNNTGSESGTGLVHGQASLISTDATDTATKGNGFDSVLFPNIAAYAVGDTCSLEFWIKTTDISGGVVSFGATAAAVQISAGKIQLVKGQTSVIGITASTYNDGNAHHVVITKSGSTVKFYIDSTDVTPSITNATLASPGLGIRVFADMLANGNASSVAGSNTTLDEVAVYGAALTSTRVLAHYTAATSSGGGGSSTLALSTHPGRFLKMKGLR